MKQFKSDLMIINFVAYVSDVKNWVMHTVLSTIL